MSWQDSIPEPVMKTLKQSWDDRVLNHVSGAQPLVMLVPKRSKDTVCGHTHAQEHIGGNLDNIWYRKGPVPKLFSDALDRLHPVDLNIIMMIYNRLVAIDRRLWEGILWIRNLWMGGSAGFMCRYVDRAAQRRLYNQLWICQDMGSGSCDHPGCDCWREIPVGGDNTIALHLLIGNTTLDVTEPERLDQIHLDWKSPVVGARNNICELGVIESTVHVAQAIFGLGIPESPFTFEEKANEVEKLDREQNVLSSAEKSIVINLRDEWNRNFRAWSINGMTGWDQALPVFRKISELREKF